jgi:hypothetical protein
LAFPLADVGIHIEEGAYLSVLFLDRAPDDYVNFWIRQFAVPELQQLVTAVGAKIKVEEECIGEWSFAAQGLLNPLDSWDDGGECLDVFESLATCCGLGEQNILRIVIKDQQAHVSHPKFRVLKLYHPSGNEEWSILHILAINARISYRLRDRYKNRYSRKT